MNSLGIMQGRLTPSKGRGIQFFPFDNWRQEFELGSTVGINEIEWIFDYDNYEDNPLWSADGIKVLKNTIKNTGIFVRSICFDYFMRRPFYKVPAEERLSLKSENIEFISKILWAMTEIGAGLLEIPMVDNSSVKAETERSQAVDFLSEVADKAHEAGVMVGCETDMPVGVFKEFLDEIDKTNIRANYDSGNSSGLGYDHEAEILSLSSYIANVHIKDRVFQGSTVDLGTGSADFDAVFSSLKRVDYTDSILLQAARGADGEEVNNIKKQILFVQDYLSKYNMG